MVALLRVNTLFQIIFSSPLRWLAGCSGELDDWSIVSLGETLDSVETALISIAEDGHSLLDPSLDPFAGIAQKQLKFATWRKERAERTWLAHDGKTRHACVAEALSEARSPAGKGNAQATERVAALAEAMANAGLKKLRCKKVHTCTKY